MKQSNEWWKTTVAVCLGAAITSMCPAPHAKVPDPVHASDLGAGQREDLETLIEDQVRERLRTQSSAHLFKALRLDRATNKIVVDLAAEFLPGGVHHVTGALEDRLHGIRTGVLGLVENELGLSLAGVEFTFDGKPLSYYYPDDFPDGGAVSESNAGSAKLAASMLAACAKSFGRKRAMEISRQGQPGTTPKPHAVVAESQGAQSDPRSLYVSASGHPGGEVGQAPSTRSTRSR